MRRDLISISIVIIALFLISMVLLGVNTLVNAEQSLDDLDASISTAAQTEANALNAVATAESIAGRNELNAAAIAGDIELLRTFLPQGDVCRTVNSRTETPSGTPGQPPTVTISETETCEPRVPSDQDVASAITRLTGTPVPAPPLVNGEETYTTRIHQQILPIDRLLPDTAGDAWQLLVPNGGDAIGGQWWPRTDEPTSASVLAYSSGAITWADLDVSSGTATVGDITHLNAGTGIAIDDATSSTPTIRLANGTQPFTDEDADKLQNSLESVRGGTGIDIDNATTNNPTVRLETGTVPFTDADHSKLDGLGALPAYQQSTVEQLHSRAGTLYWEAVNEVPDTPGTSSGVGYLLTVTGENDTDYAFRSIDSVEIFTDLEEVVNANRLGVAQAETDLANVADAQSVTVSTATSYQGTLNSQLGSSHPLWLVIDTAISGTRGGSAFSWPAGQVLYFPPTSDSPETLFVIGQASGGSGGTDATARSGVATNAAAISTNTDAIAEHTTEITNLQGGFSSNHGLILINAADIAEQDTSLGELGTRLSHIERDFVFEPDYWISSTAARSFVIHLNSGNVPPGATRIQLVIGGATKTQNVTTGDTDYQFDFTESDATNIRNNLRGRTTISSNLIYLDAVGVSLATQHVLLRVLAGAPTEVDQTARDAAAAALRTATGAAATATTAQTTADTASSAASAAQSTANTNTASISTLSGRLPATPRVIQAAVAASDTAGVLSITLPANFEDTYRTLKITWWHRGSDTYGETDLALAPLALLRSATNVDLAGTPANSRQAILGSYAPSTRIFTTTSVQIVYAVLE